MPVVVKLPTKIVQSCGRCWYGPCMCDGVTDTAHKIIPAGKSVPGIGYKGMAYTDPVARRMIDQDTAEFIAEMRRQSGRTS
jgi:hypothetical protein